MTRFCDNISTGFDGTKDYWPETGARSGAGAAMAATNARTRLGIHPSTAMEHPHDNRTSTPLHPTDHNPQTIDDWHDWGRRIALGLNEYFKYAPRVEYQVSLKQKWNLFSLPVNETINKTEVTIRNNSIDYTWSEAVTAGVILDFLYGWNRIGQSYYIADSFEPGQGYWLWSYYNCTLLVTGEPIISDSITALSMQWNIIGLPVNTTIPKNDLLIRYNGTDYNWTEATTGADPILLGFIYVWNPSVQQYQLSDVLEAGKAYWMYAYHSCGLRRS
jgi:hypothetical protein